MTYPPQWRQQPDSAQAVNLMQAHPLAQLITTQDLLRATRIPFVVDTVEAVPNRLRAHLNAQNPQVQGLDGADVLVVFSGHSTYVSPHWRVDKGRGGTYDFEEVSVRGRARIVEGIDRFRTLIDDLSSLIEPQYAEAGDYPIWQTSMAAPGYIERLYPLITQFEIEVEQCEMISKLHQQFPDEDRRSVAEHLTRCSQEGSRVIAQKIRMSLNQ
ncbi:MAG: FMN-binding negative transcriptional regulator [Phycisphaerales bacterium]